MAEKTFVSEPYGWGVVFDGRHGGIHDTPEEAAECAIAYDDVPYRVFPLYERPLVAFDMSDRTTLRLGPLAALLAAYCEKHDATPSDVIRAALAAKLRVAAPAMEGHVETIKRVNAAKRTKRKGRRGRGTGSG